MGWSDLFKPKKPAQKADPVLRWFGKVPTYADYYASATDAEWAAEFNDWFLKGYDLYQSRARGSSVGNSRGRPVPRLPISGCAIRLPKSGMTVLASVMDYGGDSEGRPFPITFYVGIPNEQWPGPDCGRLPGAMQVVQSLMGLRHEMFRFFRSPGRFESAFGGRRLDLEGVGQEQGGGGWRKEARGMDMQEWFTEANTIVGAPSLSSWLNEVSEKGRQISANDGDDFEPTLRFPLAWGKSADAQVAGWLRWLERRMRLDGRMLSVIATGSVEDPAGYLVIVARPVISQDFLLLTQEADGVAYLDDLATSRNTDDPAPGDDPEVRVKTWHDFVESPPTGT